MGGVGTSSRMRWPSLVPFMAPRSKNKPILSEADVYLFYGYPSLRIFIWRDRGSRNNPAFVHESVRFGGRGVLVYGGISIDGRTDLYIIRDGPLTARRYRDEILRPIVVPYAAAIGDDFILMDYNSRPHRANLVEDSLFEEGIVRMECPACSPNSECNRVCLGRSR
ncbi:transposable element Tcb2 transposase [Trichonephila clavipes]|nr:transposable element Tcb2 transposase [Trichonephila clavipes]